MNDTNDTILSLNKTEDQTLAFIEENFDQTYNNGGNFSLIFHSFLIGKPTFWSLQISKILVYDSKTKIEFIISNESLCFFIHRR